MKNTTYRFIFILIASIGTLCQCRKKEQEYIGPLYVPAPAGFTVTGNRFQAGYPDINFQSHTQFFIASFSAEVQWYITIRGSESGAVKKLSSISDHLDDANATWDGTSDSVFFFKSRESCLATLSFLNGTFTLSDTFSISAPKKYQGVLIDDFEKNSPGKIGFGSTYSDPNDHNVVTNFSDSTQKTQGNYSLLLQGSDTDKNYWITEVATDSNVLYQKIRAVNADSLFINLSVYGTGQSQASLEVKFEEDDSGSGRLNPKTNDSFHYLIPVDWTGWKNISIPYSAFSDTNPDIGNNTTEPSKIIQMALTLVSAPPISTLTINIDFVLLTTGQALQKQP